MDTTISHLAIRRASLGDLHPDPANARSHNERNLDAIRASLLRFGQAEPLVVQAGTGRVIGGNGRLTAMKAMGWKEADIVEVPLDDLQATALGIALNRTSELAEWDMSALNGLLQSLKVDGGLDGVGFDDKELGRILDEVIASGESLDGLVEDAVPGLPDAATTRAGDLWILGGHRLLCGDSAQRASLERLLGGARIQLVNTDPPYNVKVEPRSNNAIAAGLSSFGPTHHQKLDLTRHPSKAKATDAKLRAKDRPLMNDFVSDEEFARLLRAWFGNLAYALEPGRAFYIWGGYANVANYPSALVESELYFSQSIIWNKLHPVLTRKDFMGAHEWCFYGWREGAAHQYFGPNNATDLWEIKKVNPQSMVHLCLHPDAAVLTRSGYRSIRSIKVGDQVFSGDGKFHEVEHVSSHRYTSDHLYRITAKGGNATTDASNNHPFLIWRPTRKRGGGFDGSEIAWVRADELKAGDYTMTPVLSCDGPDPFPECDEDYWFLFGLYLAQGHLQAAGHGKRRYPVFSIHKKRQDLAERIWKQWPNAREYDPNDYSPEPSSGLTVMSFDGDAGSRFEALGGRLAHGKRLAPEVFALPRAKRFAVLQGWLNGDGCKVHDRTYWQGNTVSADLAAHLCLLAESVGYRTNVYSYDPPDDLGEINGRRFKSRRRVYYLYFYERHQLGKRGTAISIEHEGREYSLRYIKSVERIRYEGDVWNLSVEGHPSFQTAVGLSHNTEKPVELAARAIQYSSRPGENVLDLFGGSGSTLIGAEQTGRKAFLMELDPLYTDVIVDRWQRFTKQEAVLDGTTQTFAALREERIAS